MPYRFSWPDNTFFAEFSGHITGPDIEAVNYAFSGDARMETVRYALWDFSGVSSIDVPNREVENAAAFDKGVSYVREHLRGALIVTNPEVRQRLEEYLTVAQDLDVQWDTRIFETIEAAKHWLEAS